ncbi:O-antigen ligase family protein [Anaeromyxobacter sp. Fw109-5]|uniref:O-antigen ligase family protein n=1 Tax=Anaeromyxobacter sp. (strain Fw109-5) TaxID=404589 RepID=UPI00350F4B66
MAWGGLSSFSLLAGKEGAPAYQATGLALAVLGVALVQRSASAVTQWAASWSGRLLACHAAAAVASGVWSGSSMAAIARYVLLLPAFSVLAAAVRRGGAMKLQAGLIASGVLFVFVHAAQVDPSAVFDPSYRISLFLNTNGVGFIAAVTAVGLLAYLDPRRLRVCSLVAALLVACLVVIFATKSRTASLSFLAGLCVHVWLHARRARRLGTSLAAAVVVLSLVLVCAPAGDRVRQSVTQLYMLDDEHRSVQSGTYRYETWSYVVNELWLPNPLLGVGPGRHGALIEAATGVTSAHNGMLANLAEVGLLGTVPLMGMLALALARRRRSAMRHLPLVAAGIVESGAEIMMFSMGNTGSLLFLLALVAMSTARCPARRGPPIWETRGWHA